MEWYLVIYAMTKAATTAWWVRIFCVIESKNVPFGWDGYSYATRKNEHKNKYRMAGCYGNSLYYWTGDGRPPTKHISCFLFNINSHCELYIKNENPSNLLWCQLFSISHIFRLALSILKKKKNIFYTSQKDAENLGISINIFIFHFFFFFWFILTIFLSYSLYL